MSGRGETGGVPSMDVWPRVGIVGTIGRGPMRGDFVWADLFLSADGRSRSYVIHTPNGEDVYDETGRLVVPDDAADHEYKHSPGLIGELTTELGISWHTDEAGVRAVIDERFGWCRG